MSRLLAFSSHAFAALGITLASLAASPPVLAGEVADSLSREVRAVFDQCQGAVVKVEATDKTGQRSGTGFFIGPNGTLLTSFSVGGEGRDFVVISADNTRTAAHRLLSDERAGIALLKMENTSNQPTPFLSLAKAPELAVATPVVTVAYPMDMPLTPNFGMVAGFDLKYLGRYFATTHIRASVPVQRGEGGAPLLNMKGEVVGVIISSIDNGSACFALPVEAVQKIYHDYERYGEVRPGWLGVLVTVSKKPEQGTTAQIERLEVNAPAIKAGLLPGDLLLKIGERGIKSPEDVLNASFFLTAGESTPVVVWREGKQFTFEAQPAERTESERRLPGLQVIPAGAVSSEDMTLRLQ
jgi:serine protease Do